MRLPKLRRSGTHARTAPPLPPPDDRCRGQKQDGTRCKLEAGRSGYCVFHAPSKPPAAA
jgi:Family of unknown function (DUF5763)